MTRVPVLPFPSDLAYLQEEMLWIEARCKRLAAVRTLAALDGQPKAGRRYRDDSDEDPRLVALRLKAALADETRLRTQIDQRLVLPEANPTSLDRLCTMHKLDNFERTLVLLSAAPAFSRGFEEHFASVMGDRHCSSAPTVELAFNFFELSFSDRILRRTTFSKHAPLFANDVLVFEALGRLSGPEELLSADIRMASRTFAFLVGHQALSADLIEFSAIETPLARLDQVVLPDEDKGRILSVIENHDQFLHYRREWGFDRVIQYGRGVLLLFSGPPGTGKTMTAHGIANHLGKRVLNVDIPAFVESREADHYLPALFREARLQDALLFFDECDSLFASRRHGNQLMNVLLTEIERFEGVAVLATNSPDALDPALDRRILVKVRFAEPDQEARVAIWKKHMPSEAPFAADVDVNALASQFEISGGYIKNAVLTALAAAVHGKAAVRDTAGDEPKITMQQLEKAAKAQVHRTTDDHVDLTQPRVTLADVVLPPDVAEQVSEIVDAARNRRVVLERWGIGTGLSYGTGVCALLSGPPGTGKTLCAEAIAGELNRPLYNVSARELLSKWVGESEQKVGAAFRSAKATGAVLFLDEAESLLGDRSANDLSRHDHSVVNTLLVQIERFDGVVLLASNQADKLDAALSRRLGWKVAFPVPDATSRAAIWRKRIPASVPVEGPIDCDILARRHRLSGGQIKNAVLRAAFRAARSGGALTFDLLDAAAIEEGGGERAARAVGFAS